MNFFSDDSCYDVYIITNLNFIMNIIIKNIIICNEKIAIDILLISLSIL